jgi:integrase
VVLDASLRLGRPWYAALERVGISGFRWHDLRQTWASWHVQNVTLLFALQELGGWASTEMVRRYAHLAADHLAPYAERPGTVRTGVAQSHGANPSRSQN